MKKALSLILLGGLVFSVICSAVVHDGKEGLLSDAGNFEALSGSGDDASSTACLASLRANSGGGKISELSVFREFNKYPPVPSSVLKPRNVKLPAGQINLASQCLAYLPFDFDVFDDDKLRKGRLDDVSPIYLWEVETGYLVVYIYRGYEQEDGEGEMVVMSAAMYDALGRVDEYIKEVSSWYEYEGSIRIRDAKFRGREVVISEMVFDPVRLGVEGRVLKYRNTGGSSKIRSYVWGVKGYIEQ